MKQQIPLLPLLSGLCVMLLALLPSPVGAANIAENPDYTQGSVNVATPGTLQQLIVDMDEVPQSLTVTGCLNAEDVVYIREGKGSMAQVKEIDLSTITLQPGPGCYSAVVVGRLDVGIGNITMKFYIDNTFHCDTTGSGNGVSGYVDYNVYNNQLYGAFAGNTTLEKVVLPAGNEAVGQYMFCGSNIKRVGFPSAPNAIENSAFKNTPELLALNIPASVQKIEDRAFQESGLTEFTLPDGCTSIGDYAFYKTPLHSINLGHVTEMGQAAFYQTKIQNTDLSGLTEIPTELFYESDVRSITFNPALKSIGGLAFYGNKNLLSVVLPEGLEEIGKRTFDECSKLMDITIPSTLSVIGYDAFPWNWVREQPAEDGIYYLGHVAYSLADSWPSNPELTFKEGTVSISPTFGNYYLGLLIDSLKKITFPSTMKIIGAKEKYSNMIFWECEELEEVVFNEGLETIGSECFKSCKKLKVPYWPESLRYIGENAFMYTQVSSLTLGPNMEYCGYDAFKFCPSLATVKLYAPNLLTEGQIFYGSGVEKVVIGKDVQRVPNDFLSRLENLVRVIWEDPDAEGPALEIGNGAFSGVISMEVDIPKRTLRIGENAFSRAKTKDIDLSLVDSIGAYAFNNSSGLVNLNIGKNCHYCGEAAFYDLPTLRTVYWNMPTTEYSPFYGYCKPAIVEMTIGPDVEFLPSNFCPQSSLETLNFEPRGAQSRSEGKGLLIDEEAFLGNQWLKTINFPDCRTAIGANAFEGCKSLVNLRLGAGLENIDKRGFYRCANLKSVDIPESVVEIGEEAFKCFYSGEGVEKVFFHNEAGVWLQQSICGTNVDIFVPAGSEEAYKNTSLRNNPIIPYAITSLTLSDEEIDIPDGQLYPLEATINPAEFDGLNIVWESSDTTVATVGADGMVEAIATGTATVKAYIRFMPEYFAECTVKVNGGAGVEQVAEDPDTISVKVENGAIVASGFEGTMEVYDLAGRLVALSTNGRVNSLLPGLYIVKAGALTAKVRL